MTICLNDLIIPHNLRPFSDTRHVADMRIGILTIREKWALLTGGNIRTSISHESDERVIPAHLIPTSENYVQLLDLARGKEPDWEALPIKKLQYPWQIFQYNDWAIREDYKLITKNRISAPLSASNQVIQPENIFLESGAAVTHCTLNASTGPIYIGKNAQLMEGCLVRGPFAAGENSIAKMGTKIYGATSMGPGCMIGGEIKNSILFEYSNKAHDGYLGDSVLGAWCNLGAGTSNSNVKNTGGTIRYYLDENGPGKEAGTKAGLLMGDYSRAAINTSFTTGTVVGVCCNVFGEMMSGAHIPNFSWGQHRYEFEKALRDIDNWKKMKQQSITDSEKEILKQLYYNQNSKDA